MKQPSIMEDADSAAERIKRNVGYTFISIVPVTTEV